MYMDNSADHAIEAGHNAATTVELTNEIKDLIRNWYRKCEYLYMLHQESSIRYERYNRIVSLPILVLSAFTSTTIFTTSSSPNNGTLQIVIGTFCALMGILSSMQSHFNFSKKSEIHHDVSKGYLTVMKKFETYLSLYKSGMRVDSLHVFIHSVLADMEKIETESPNLPFDLYTKYMSMFKNNLTTHGNLHIKILDGDTPPMHQIEPEHTAPMHTQTARNMHFGDIIGIV